VVDLNYYSIFLQYICEWLARVRPIKINPHLPRLL